MARYSTPEENRQFLEHCLTGRYVQWYQVEEALLERLRGGGYSFHDFDLLRKMHADRRRSRKYEAYLRWYPYLDPNFREGAAR